MVTAKVIIENFNDQVISSEKDSYLMKLYESEHDKNGLQCDFYSSDEYGRDSQENKFMSVDIFILSGFWSVTEMHYRGFGEKLIHNLNEVFTKRFFDFIKMPSIEGF